MRRWWIAVVAPVALIAVVGLVLMTHPQRAEIDQARAVTLAGQFLQGAHGSGATLTDVAVEGVQPLTPLGGHPVWRVQIHGSVTEAGSTHVSDGSVMWLDVDMETGAVTVWPRG